MACVVFCGGCNLRCAYCHNPHLVLDPTSQPLLADSYILDFLGRRVGRLEGVVFSGGEPTLSADLADFMVLVKQMGFAVRLDSNGCFPDRVQRCHELAGLDSLAIDYKLPCRRYSSLAAVDAAGLGERVWQTLRYAVAQGIPTEVRTTVHRALLSEEDLACMRDELNGIGIGLWWLQQFHAVDTLVPELSETPTYSDAELRKMARVLGGDTRTRGA